MPPIDSKTSSDPFKLTILHFNDLHGYLRQHEDGKGGSCNLAAEITAIKDENKSKGIYTIVLVGGDTAFGTSMSKLSEGEAEFKFLNELGVDAMVVGNHDLDYGQDRFEKNVGGMSFPVLSTNILDAQTNKLFVKPTYIINLNDRFRVGIAGVTTPQTPSMSKPVNVAGLTFTDPLAATDEYVKELSGQTEIQIVLAHMTRPEDESLLNKAGAGIEILIGGHDHVTPNDYCKVVNDIPMCETPPEGSFLGRIDLTYENGQTHIDSSTLIPVEAKEGRTCPANVEKGLSEYFKKSDEYEKKIIGESQFELKGHGEEFIGKPTPLAEFAAKVMKDETGTEIGIINGSSVRGDLKKGTITQGELYKIFPFETNVVKVKVTADEILQILKMNEARISKKRSPYNFAGLAFEKEGENFKVEVNGIPLDTNKTYEIATADFLMTGDFAGVLKDSSPVYMETSLRDMMAKNIVGGVK